MKRLLFVLLVLFISTSAFAQATRTWVSGVGDDVNPCSRTAPCKTFAGAISKTAAGGEINAIDPGAFGAVTIVKSMTIDGAEQQAGVLATGGSNGIIVNAGVNDQIVLRNLDINGAGTGLNGIRILSAKSVTIENCVIGNFTNRGIDINMAAGLTNVRVIVNNTKVRNVGNIGIVATSTTSSGLSLLLDNVDSSGHAAHGVYVTNGSKGGITNSTFRNNGGAGIFVDSANTRVAVGYSSMLNNGTGIQVGQAGLVGSQARLFGNLISLNATGVINTSSTVESNQNNSIVGNTTTNISGTVTPVGQQ